jgi:DNA (cytosine-5)-methyltransferase 1
MLRVLDLFSGIGGFSLGLERTGGFETVAFCEIEEFPRRVLAKHWPGVPIYDDVRTLTAERLAADGIAVDVICGGFPCQDISDAGRRAGIEGARSGLWSEIARLAGELRPRFVIVENVAALLGRGFGTVLGDLAALGFDAEWHCIPASYVGAPHERDRVWIVAYARSEQHESPRHALRGQGAARLFEAVADADRARLEERQGPHTIGAGACQWSVVGGSGWWTTEPALGRVANGVPARVDRLKALGNAVVPQIPELIGRAILQAEAA